MTLKLLTLCTHNEFMSHGAWFTKPGAKSNENMQFYSILNMIYHWWCGLALCKISLCYGHLAFIRDKNLICTKPLHHFSTSKPLVNKVHWQWGQISEVCLKPASKTFKYFSERSDQWATILIRRVQYFLFNKKLLYVWNMRLRKDNRNMTFTTQSIMGHLICLVCQWLCAQDTEHAR